MFPGNKVAKEEEIRKRWWRGLGWIYRGVKEEEFEIVPSGQARSGDAIL